MIKLSVIIVNWNVRDLLEDCLRSLFTYNAELALEVYVVDNHSSDGSVEFLKRDFPQVKLIENDENIGFSKANNQGIHHAQGRYILLLNPDTVWVDDSLQRMVTFMDNHPEIGVVGPKLLNADKQSIQYCGARRLPRPLDTFFEYTRLSSLFPRNRLLGRHLMADWDHTDSREVDCLSGACLLVRRETIQEVGLLDEGYPLYQEDIDWCHRVGLTQWKLYYFAEAHLIHVGRQSTLQNRGPSTINAVRGVYLYYHKFHGATAVLWVWLLIWLASIAKLLVWVVVFLLRPGSRELALKQMKAFWKVCWLPPM
jgi:GT2 family glycosyltransferase